MHIVGITGTIGAGKSFAAALLQQQNYPVFNADAVLHTHWFDDAVQADLQQLLGVHTRTERADVKTWLSLDPQKLRQLEQTLYPHLDKLLQQFLITHQQQHTPCVVLDVPLLFEKGWHTHCTTTICMVAPAWLCAWRALKRPHTSKVFYQFLLSQHWPQAQKAQAADYVINSLWGKNYVAWRLRCVIKKLTHTQT